VQGLADALDLGLDRGVGGGVLGACIRASVLARACRVMTWPRAWLAWIRSRATAPIAAGNLIAASCRSNWVAVATSALRSARAAARLLRSLVV
jgi:hypothetical protein